MPRIANIKPRGGTAAQWTSANPVLSAREIGIETDTQKSKYGNGTTAWNDLPYSVANASGTSTVNWNSVLDKPTTFTPSAHTHVKADITDFTHTHVMADVTDLEFPPTTVLADTAPTSPTAGERWVDTTSFIEYIYYDSTWVEV